MQISEAVDNTVKHSRKGETPNTPFQCGSCPYMRTSSLKKKKKQSKDISALWCVYKNDFVMLIIGLLTTENTVSLWTYNSQWRMSCFQESAAPFTA